MQVIRNEQGTVTNCIFEDGLQISVKTNPSGWFEPDQMDRDNPITEHKNKVSVVISTSVGCPLKCTFCHLTKMSKPYQAVPAANVVTSVVRALEATAENGCDFSDKYLKLCFMGEGEPIIGVFRTMEIAERILEWAVEGEVFAGVDGIDISTTMPVIDNQSLVRLGSWNIDLARKYAGCLNPANYNFNNPDRTVVRVFYSLHHFDQAKRKQLIPNVKPISESIAALSELNNYINVIVHYMFMEGVNDDYSEDVLGLIDWVNNTPEFKEFEFRVLRYNPYNGDSRESTQLKDFVSVLMEQLLVKRFKVQYSAGEEVAAACGMFIDVEEIE